MMKQSQPKHLRILGIAPTSRGFGFAVLEGLDTLVDWGNKSVKRDKNAQSLAKLGELLALYEPDVLVLPDALAKNTHRASRIKTLVQQMIDLGKTRKIKVALFSPEQVKRRFFADGEGTKHDVCKIIADRFQAELGDSVPPKRELWMHEDHRMGFFEALALAQTFRLKTTKLMV
jgi:Holliday junction resolvasome RuvABC endonuclease subunit